ncbi:nucleoside hydrolase [Leifsonia xyli]|uniref:nucleoside hydrolase n=1 Tax=Leifsonia xyli TaxID=1575 RepID=UPI003D67E6B4
MPTHRIILDTDIGSDVDDALALVQILGTPSLTLDGVTTVYGDSSLRARIVRRYAGLAGVDLLAHPGEETPSQAGTSGGPATKAPFTPTSTARRSRTRLPWTSSCAGCSRTRARSTSWRSVR